MNKWMLLIACLVFAGSASAVCVTVTAAADQLSGDLHQVVDQFKEMNRYLKKLANY